MMLRAIIVSLGLALLAASTPAQERPQFSAQSDLVVIHALVQDRRGAAVPGLEQKDFLVYEDNRPQGISFFSSADAPASIGLLIDNSTSMMTKRERVIAAAVSFTGLSNPEDEIFVLAFNENVRVAWPPTIIAKSHVDIMRRVLTNEISALGKTALYDAIIGGLERLERARHQRQVLVVVSDGSDNASATSLEDMIARTQTGNAMIYTVALQDPVDFDGNPRLLKRISTATGGESFSPRTINAVPEALEHIARDIRATYTIGYVPSNLTRDGKMRRLRVSARGPDGKTLKVQTRGGYIAPKASNSAQQERDRAR